MTFLVRGEILSKPTRYSLAAECNIAHSLSCVCSSYFVNNLYHSIGIGVG